MLTCGDGWVRLLSRQRVTLCSQHASWVARFMPDLIPLRVRLALRDAVGGWGPYDVQEIHELFAEEGFAAVPGHASTSTGQRRAAAESIQAGIDWSNPSACTRYLRIVERVLEDQDQSTEDGRKRHVNLARALDRASILRDHAGRLALPSRTVGSTRWVDASPSVSDIRMHVARLERFDQEPEELVGAAKDLVEAVAKHVLIELGESVPDTADVASLSKRALTALRLHPDGVAPTARGAQTIVRMLGGLGQIAAGLAELRNEGYGTGHGRGRRVAGVGARHAEFAARAAVTYAAFVLDTLADPTAPWRNVEASAAVDD
jgi:hypothetical protein